MSVENGKSVAETGRKDYPPPESLHGEVVELDMIQLFGVIADCRPGMNIEAIQIKNGNYLVTVGDSRGEDAEYPINTSLQNLLKVVQEPSYGYEELCTKHAAGKVWRNRDEVPGALWVGKVPLYEGTVQENGSGKNGEYVVVYDEMMALPTNRNEGAAVIIKGISDEGYLQALRLAKNRCEVEQGSEKAGKLIDALIQELEKNNQGTTAELVREGFIEEKPDE
jgi:hypothetical protein